MAGRARRHDALEEAGRGDDGAGERADPDSRDRAHDRTERMNTMNASTQELAFAPISTVAESVRKKELSPVELVRASLARIEALDSKLNSFYTLFRDDVMAAARAAPRSPAANIAGRCT